MLLLVPESKFKLARRQFQLTMKLLMCRGMGANSLWPIMQKLVLGPANTCILRLMLNLVELVSVSWPMEQVKLVLGPVNTCILRLRGVGE